MLRLILIAAIVAVCHVRGEEGDSDNVSFCKNVVLTAVIACTDKYDDLGNFPNIDEDVFCRLADGAIKCVEKAMIPPNETCGLKAKFLAQFKTMIDELQKRKATLNC
ncbi:Uncharacterised protein g6437 [Pycnogonum litorale]